VFLTVVRQTNAVCTGLRLDSASRGGAQTLWVVEVLLYRRLLMHKKIDVAYQDSNKTGEGPRGSLEVGRLSFSVVTGEEK